MIACTCGKPVDWVSQSALSGNTDEYTGACDCGIHWRWQVMGRTVIKREVIKPIIVAFHYDEVTHLWEPFVEGPISDTEARQAFSAVVLSCQMLNPDLLIHTKTERVDEHQCKIIPAV